MNFAPVYHGNWVIVDRISCAPKLEGVFLLLIHGERFIQRWVCGWLLVSDNFKEPDGGLT